MSKSIKSIEDYLCDLVDGVFNDSTTCTKELDMNNCPSRCAKLTSGPLQLDDHNIIGKASGQITIITRKRSTGIAECDKLLAIFPVNDKVAMEKDGRSFAISVLLDYSMVPYKLLIGTTTAHMATINVTIIST